MYAMVLMASLTTSVDLPDRRGGGCCGCYGGMGWGGGWGACYGGWGGCYGMGWGGWGGCYGMGWGGGWGGCYGMGWGGGYGGYVLGGASPMIGGYAYTPMISGYGRPLAGINGGIVNPGVTQSFYANPAIANPAIANQGNEATLVVHVPANASLTIDGQPTQSRSATRIFHSPPLERGKTYTYTLRGELNRDGHFVQMKKNVEVRAGERSEVTLSFGNDNRAASEDEGNNQVPQVRQRRTPAVNPTPGEPSFPTPPRD